LKARCSASAELRGRYVATARVSRNRSSAG
jgi:hypothetical protein